MDAPTITAAGLEAMDDVGLDKLSMRTVAARLGVQVGGLYYHVSDKAALLRAMADVLCRRALDDLSVTGQWQQDAVAFCLVVRRTVLSTRDGARLLAQSPLVGSTEAIELMERLMRILSDGVPSGRLGQAADTLMSYLTGFALQEQLASRATGFDAATLTALTERFPLVFRADGSGDDEANFVAAVEAIIAGFSAPASGPERSPQR